MKFLRNYSLIAMGMLIAFSLLINSQSAYSNNNVKTVKMLQKYSTLPSDPSTVVVTPELKSQLQPGMNNYQSKPITGREIYSNPKNQKIQGGKKSVTEFDPNTLPGIQIGMTYYDFQTNSSMPNRLSYYEDGTSKYCQMIWMADDQGVQNTYNGRGTFYEVIDLNDPTKPQAAGQWTSRIEGAFKTGFPSIVQFKDGRIGTPSHDARDGIQKLLFSKNDAFAGTFTTKILEDKKVYLWPRSAIDDKENIHVIFVDNDSLSDNYREFLYLRSTDGGNNFETAKLLTGPNAFDGATTSGPKYTAESYTIDARGDAVVVGYWDDNGWYVYRKSTDNGSTWTTPRAAISMRHDTYYITEDLGNNRVKFVSDTVIGAGSNIDVILDSKFNAHFIANVSGESIHGIGLKVSDTEIRRLTEAELPNADTTSGFYYMGLAFFYTYEGNDTIRTSGNVQGPDEANADNSSVSEKINSRYGGGLTSWPQLGIDDEDNLYCVYGGVKNSDTKSVQRTVAGGGLTTVNGFISHLYLMTKPAGWNHFGRSINLTPDGADCQFPSLSNQVPVINGVKYMLIGYIADGTPGDRVTNTNLTEEETYINMMAIPETALAGTIPVEEQEINTVTTMNVTPNPANDYTMVTLNNSTERNNVKIEVFNLLGNKVATLYNGQLNAGNFAFRLNTSSLSSGVYYCSFVANGEKVSKMINIVR
jgi:hypothetical protein